MSSTTQAVATHFRIHSLYESNVRSEFIRPGTLAFLFGFSGSPEIESINRLASDSFPALVSKIEQLHKAILRRRETLAQREADYLCRFHLYYAGMPIVSNAYISADCELTLLVVPYRGAKLVCESLALERVSGWDCPCIETLVLEFSSHASFVEQRANELLWKAEEWTSFLPAISCDEMRPTAEMVHDRAVDHAQARERAEHMACAERTVGFGGLVPGRFVNPNACLYSEAAKELLRNKPMNLLGTTQTVNASTDVYSMMDLKLAGLRAL
jgi:hypothetical protein